MGSGLRAQGSGLRAQGSGLRAQGSGLRRIIKLFLGKKNVERILCFRRILDLYKMEYHYHLNGENQNNIEKLKHLCLMKSHALEKYMVLERKTSLDSFNYNLFIDDIEQLLKLGVSSSDFAVKESIAVLSGVFNKYNYDEAKIKLNNLINSYSLENNFKGGVEGHTRSELLKINPENWHDFVSSRHSIRKFKDKIIPRETVISIINDAKYYPSACNRQPCKIYFSENPETVQKIVDSAIDQFVIKGNVHDAFIVTCDRALFVPGEIHQVYVNGGIFLAYLVMSIHAHGLGSCLFEFGQNFNSLKNIREKFNIPESEVIIAFIGFGELEDEKILTACAQRRSPDEIAIEI